MLTKPQDMFDDIVLNYAPFADFCRKLGRPLRVATMCSGTESPMLALAMLSRAVEAQGPDSNENNFGRGFNPKLA